MKNKEVCVRHKTQRTKAYVILWRTCTDTVIRSIVRLKKKRRLWVIYNNQLSQMPAFSSCVLVEIVSLLEFVNASAGVNKFLFAREIRMAFGANFNSKFVDVFGRTRLECVSACTHDRYVVVLGMDSFFHFDSPNSFFYTHTRQYVTRI